MPLINARTDKPYTLTETPEKDFGAMDIIGASITQHSDVFGYIREGDNPMPDPTEQEKTSYITGAFKPLDYMEGSRHDTDDRRHDYADLESPSQIAWMDVRYDEQDNAQIVRDASPWYQMLVPDFVSTFASPTSLLAGGVGAATKLARGIQYGLKGMAAAGSQEVILQQQQYGRDMGMSAAITVGTGVMGFGMGAITGKKALKRIKGEEVEVSPDFSGTRTTASPTPPMTSTAVGGESGGSARVSLQDQGVLSAVAADPNLTSAQKFFKTWELRAEPHSPVNPTALKSGGFGVMHRAIPEQRTILNDNPIMRILGDNLLNHPAMTNANKAWKGGVPLEEMAKLPQKQNAVFVPKAFKDGYADYSKTFTGTKMTKSSFDRAVQNVATSGKSHPDAAVNKVAQWMINNKLKPMGDRLEAEGMLAQGAKALGDEGGYWWARSLSKGYAASVTDEQWAAGLMNGHINSLMRKVKKGGGVQPPTKEVAEAQKMLTRKELKKFHEALKGSRNSLVHGSKEFGSEYSGVGVLKDNKGIWTPSKQRKLDIATEDFPEEYLVQDTVGSLVSRLNALERELAAYEDARFGDPTLANYTKMRRTYYDTEVGELRKAGASDKELKKLKKKLDNDLADIDGFAHRYNGMKVHVTSATAQNITSFFLAANSVTKLGRAILSQVPEVFSTVGTVGVRGLVQHLNSRVLSPKIMQGLNRQARREMAAGLDIASSVRYAEKGIFDETSPAFAKAMNKGADFIVDKVFMIGYWTRFARAEAAVMVQAKLGRLALKAREVEVKDASGRVIGNKIEGISKREKLELARMGITEDIFPAVMAEVKAHHNPLTGGVIDAGLGKWTNTKLKNTVNTAIAADVKHYQLEPGIGSMPFLGDHVAGALALQFKTFLMMATSRHLMAGIQKGSMGDPKAFIQMAMMTAAGSLGYSLRAQSYNREVDLSTERLVREGFTRGGWFGMTGDAHAILEQLSGGQLSAFNLLGFEQKTSSNYFGARTIYSTGIGPTGQFMKDFIDLSMGVTSMILNGEASKGQIRAARRMVPMNNYVAINTPLFAPVNAAENALIQKFTPERKGRSFLK